MTHPLVQQLRFTRSEFRRGLAGLSEADAQTRVGAMNSISWNVGHLAWQEQRYFLYRLQGQLPNPLLQEKFCYGCPALTPPLADMWAAWEAVTTAADPYLDTLTNDQLTAYHPFELDPRGFTAGNLMQRVIYHYWFHTGENLAIRQALGHTDLPEFVGAIDEEAPYVPH